MASSQHKMCEEHREFLRKKREYLVENLDVENVLIFMPSHIFDQNSEEEIKNKATQKAKVVKFLDILPRRGPDAFEAFIKATYKIQDWLGEYLASEAGIDLNEILPAEDEGPGMKEVHRKILRNYLPEFIATLDVERMVKSLVKAGIMKQGNPGYAEAILEEQPRSKRVEKLMEVLPKLGPKAFDAFFSALKVNQPQFAFELRKSIEEKYPDVQLDTRKCYQESNKCTANDAVATDQKCLLSTPCKDLPQQVLDLAKEQLDQPSEVLENDWKRFYKVLELPDGKENVIAAKGGSPTGHVIKFWIDRDGKKATLEEFLKALKECQQGGLAHNIEQILGVELPVEPATTRDLVDGVATMSVEESKKNKAIKTIKDIPPDLKRTFVNRLNGLEEGVLSDVATKVLEERCYVRNATDFLDKIGECKTRILFRELRKANQCDVAKWMRDKFPSGSTGPMKSDDELRAAKMNYGRRLEVTQVLNAKGKWKTVASHPDVDMDAIDITLLEQAQHTKNAAECVLSNWEVRSKSTVGTMYDLLVDCGFNSVADLL